MKNYNPFFDYTNYDTYYTYFKQIIMFPIACIRCCFLGFVIGSIYVSIKILDKKYRDSILLYSARAWIYGFGYNNIKIKNKEFIKNAVTNKAIFIYNHGSFMDPYVISSFIYPCTQVSYYKFYNMFKDFCVFFNFISINDDIRYTLNSKKIVDHINNYKSIISIAPEGAVHNGTHLLRFRTGAFITSHPIQPIIIKYPNTYVKSTFSINYSALFIIYNTLIQFSNSIEIELLPLQYRKEDELPIDFAERIRVLMSEVSGIPMIDVYGYEKYNVNL